ncbi:hypothetical protein FQR65_LT02017 [Abscondita terminalis]|nr:hypothetical protein FQR65_LT02017 [Abscondita terminalis]
MAQPPPYSPQDSKVRYGPPPPGFVPPATLNTTPAQFSPPPIHGNVHINDYPPPLSNTTNLNFSPPPMHGNTIVLSPEVIVTNFGPHSQSLICPYCHEMSRTKIVNETGTKTHLIALCLCLFLCWPCACLPYCIDSCQVQNHYCGNCGAFVGSYDS